ncbi:MAG: GNVR domain-containing protein [Pseudomonadota bacterium]
MNEYIGLLKRRILSIVIPTLAICIAAVIVAIRLPSTYRSTTTILVEEQQIPEDFVRSTVTSYVDQRIQTITQEVMSRARLLEIASKFSLYANVAQPYSTEEMVQQMRDDIQLETISAQVRNARTTTPAAITVAFQLSYEGRTPETVQKVTNELASLYMEENLKTRSEQAAVTTTFLNAEQDTIRKRIAELEQKLGIYKRKHFYSLPEFQQTNLHTMDQTERDTDSLHQQIKMVQERKTLLEGQLAALRPNTPVIGSTGERVLSPSDQLEITRTAYVSLKATLSERHPDVIKAKRQMEELQQETGREISFADMAKRLENAKTQLAALKGKFSDKHPEVEQQAKRVTALEAELAQLSTASITRESMRNADNPAYVSIRSQVQSSEVELTSLKAELARAKTRLSEVQARIGSAPAFEGEYNSLLRDRENAQKSYEEITAKLTAAKMAQGLEEEQKGEKFTIIEPAELPEKPYRPNRPAISIVGLVAGLAVGVTTALTREFLDTSVRSAPAVAELTGYPVLASIPFIGTASDRRRWLRRKLVWATVAVACLVMFLLLTASRWERLLRMIG